MKTARYHLFQLLKRLGLILFLYTLCRLVFYTSNYEIFHSASVAKAFLGGIRFDLSAIALSNMPIIVLSMLPIPRVSTKGYQRFLLVLLLIINVPCIAMNLLDSEYYKFTSKRSTADFFDLMFLSDDMLTLMPSYIKDYWWLFLGLGLMIFLAIRYIKKSKFKGLLERRIHIGWQSLGLILIAGFSVLAIRGGGQLRPIDDLSALAYGRPQDISLITNTPFSIFRSWNKSFLERRNFMSDEEMEILFNPIHLPDSLAGIDKKNVVILIMESFSKEYVGQQNENGLAYTPFLDSLSEAGVDFDDSFANGRTSIAALPSVLSGIPALMDQPFITSPYKQTPTDALPYLLSKHGYTSHFYHGGQTGTMGFDRYCRSAGFSSYTGMEDYPTESDYDGNWGIYDRPFFRYAAEELSKKKEPFLATLFSLSSHHPYGIPAELQDTYAPYTDDLGRSIRYADDALKDFFYVMEENGMMENTLFIVTADHIPLPRDESFATYLGCFSVPIVFYDRSARFQSNSVAAQQTDIVPTVIDYLGIPEKHIAWGKSLLDSEENWTVQYINSFYQIYDNGFLLRYDGRENITLYDVKDGYTKIESPMKPLLLRRLQAMIQQYENRLIDGELRSIESSQ